METFIFLVGAVLLLVGAGSLASRAVNGSTAKAAVAVGIGTAVLYIPYMAFSLAGNFSPVRDIYFTTVIWIQIGVAALLGFIGGVVGRRVA